MDDSKRNQAIKILECYCHERRITTVANDVLLKLYYITRILGVQIFYLIRDLGSENIVQLFGSSLGFKIYFQITFPAQYPDILQFLLSIDCVIAHMFVKITKSKYVHHFLFVYIENINYVYIILVVL